MRAKERGRRRSRKRAFPFDPERAGSGHGKRRHESDGHCPVPKAKRQRIGGGDETRRWVYSPRDLSAHRDRFVIVSYNILGVENASKHLDLYDKVASHHLSWDQRKRRIQRELSHYNPTILCFQTSCLVVLCQLRKGGLQEVDRFSDLSDLLHGDGYVGVYKGRTGEANDGCAIFWKDNQFTLLHQENIEFRKFGLRENVAQLCLLKVSSRNSNTSRTEGAKSQVSESFSGRTLLVGNIHVLFNPNRGDIKLGQVRVLLQRAHALSREWGNSHVVISGDLNSMPQSAVYQYLSSSELDILKYDRKKISGQIEFSLNKTPSSGHCDALRSPMCVPNSIMYRWSEEEIRLASGSRGCTRLLNPMKLFSAYRGVPGSYRTRDNDGEPLVTSYHAKFMGTVDYIWHSASLSPVGVVETLPIPVLKKLGGLPSEKWGSDHLALACEFAFMDDAQS